MVALELDDAEAAAELYQKAADQKRDFVEAHYNLGNALMRLGQAAEAAAAYGRAARLRPDMAAIHNNLGNALQAEGRHEEAAQAYERALARAADMPEIHRNLGVVLTKAGRRAEGIAAFRRAVALKPQWSLAYSSLANALLEAGDAQAVVPACDAWLAAHPGTIEAIVLKSLALNEIGDARGARFLVDLDRFVQVLDLAEPPPGYADMAAFNAALTRHALGHPTLHLPPESDPRYHCPTLRITDEFLVEGDGPAGDLLRIVDRAVADYLATAARPDPSHPFLVDPPRRWALTSWSAVLDRQGSLDPHMHLDGYVSGVYYPKIPPGVGSGAAGTAGWFELGRPPDYYGCRKVPEIRAIEPREGRMILFPSYFYHRTIPFEGPEPRISIAFDAMPRR
jgi:Tfp pilus assembly protein PilF